MKKPTETDLVRACLGLLTLHRVPAWRANAGVGLRGSRRVRASPEGTADVLAVLPPGGRLLGVECKSPKGRLRPAQVAWARNVTRAGALYVVVRDVKELLAILRAEGAIP